jgi:hypothetical protein
VFTPPKPVNDTELCAAISRSRSQRSIKKN